MERPQDDRRPVIVEVIPGHRPAPVVLDHAYDLWAWKHAKNCAAVAKELGIEPRTVQRWCRDEGWHIRYEEERAEIAPQLARYQTALILGTAAPKAAAKLEAMLDGVIPWDKTVAFVCGMVLDRAGFSQISLRDTDHGRKPAQEPTKQLPDLTGKSADELEALERQYLEGGR